MKIYESLIENDLKTLQHIARKYNFNPNNNQTKKRKHKKKDDYLGDSIESLMSSNSYKRVSGSIRQVKWQK